MSRGASAPYGQHPELHHGKKLTSFTSSVISSMDMVVRWGKATPATTIGADSRFFAHPLKLHAAAEAGSRGPRGKPPSVASVPVRLTMTAARLGVRRALRLAQPSRAYSVRATVASAQLPRLTQQTSYTATLSRAPRLALQPLRTISTLVSKPEHPEDESVLEGDPPLVHLTERAINKIKAVAESDNDPKTALRIIVEPGGCHGYMYKLEITNKYDDDDLYVPTN